MRKDWTTTSLTNVVERVTSKNVNLLDRVFTVSAEYGLVQQEAFFNKRVASKNLGGYTVVEPGSFVYNKSYSADAPVGVIARNKGAAAGVVSPLYFVFRVVSETLLPEFLELFAKSSQFENVMRTNMKSSGRAHGAINMTLGEFFGISISFPSVVEQKRIVDVVSSVDTYIESLQSQVDAARTARNAVLHELLSAGGDDWTETSLGEIAEYINGYPFKPGDLGDEGTPVIRIKQLLEPLETVDRTTVDVPEKCILQDGDIVFSWSGTLAVRVWQRGHAFLNQHLFRVVAKSGVVHEWLPLVIDYAIDELVDKSHGTTMKHITKQTLLPHKVLLPPTDEQKRIVDVVSSMDEVIHTTESTLVEAKRLRSGLLSDLLSGEHEIPESYDRFLGAA